MSTIKGVRVISDEPINERAVFGFDAYSKTLAGLIARKENKTPLVIGVYGPWGSGKTTLMKMTQRYLNQAEFTNKDLFRPCKTVWFQAWKYSQQEEILSALIKVILESIRCDNSYATQLRGLIETGWWQTNVSKAVLKLAQKFIKLDFSEFIRELPHQSKLSFYDTFSEFFDRLVWTYTRLRPKFSSTEDPDDKLGALVIFIDDLDRCPKDRIVGVLETIKLFMDKKGCIFVIGAAEGIIEDAINREYESENARKFMDKIVQVTFKLPQIAGDTFDDYLELIDQESYERIKPHLSAIVPTIQFNPRRFKRFLNDLSLLEGLHANKETGVKYEDLLYWKLIEFESPELVEQISENAQIYTIFSDLVNAHGLLDETSDQFMIPAEAIVNIKEKSLTPFLENTKLVNLINQAQLNDKKVKAVVALEGIVESTTILESEDMEQVSKEYKKVKMKKEYIEDEDELFISKGAVSAIEMVNIDQGDFLFGEHKEIRLIEGDYEIDIYPVTFKRFKEFIKSGGYIYNHFWSSSGQNWRIKRFKPMKPAQYDSEKWNDPDKPIVGISYYEAEAFCNWLTETQKDGFVYRLPSEVQWERAARGTDGRLYPWGIGFEADRCNTKESGIGKTTRVKRFPNGVSPDGCYDMAGNVWEWTSTKENRKYVLKGGSYLVDRYNALSIARVLFAPEERDSFIGFRCIRNKEDKNNL